MGTGYWARLIFLFFLIIIITWYAKQGYNNPFAPRPHIQLVGSNGYTYIRFFKKVRKKETDSFLYLLPNFASFKKTASTINFPETFTLITTDINKEIYNNFKTPPSNWIILDTSLANDSSSKPPETWPIPSFTNDIAGIKDIAINYVYPFDDTLAAVYLEYNEIKIILFNNSQITLDTAKESFFKEKFDIVIINTESDPSILKIRDNLRPRHLIALPSVKTNEEIQSIPNIIKPESGNFIYEIYKDSKKRLYVKERNKKRLSPL